MVAPTKRERLEEAFRAIACNPIGWSEGMLLIFAAARAHLDTLPKPPKTKIIEAWHVEFWDDYDMAPYIKVCADKVIAEAQAFAMGGMHRSCIRVTGPHPHEVPL